MSEEDYEKASKGEHAKAEFNTLVASFLKNVNLVTAIVKGRGLVAVEMGRQKAIHMGIAPTLTKEDLDREDLTLKPQTDVDYKGAAEGLDALSDGEESGPLPDSPESDDGQIPDSDSSKESSLSGGDSPRVQPDGGDIGEPELLSSGSAKDIS